MVSLKSGVLLKLLEAMNMENNSHDDDQKAVLLQIRSIIPVLEEGDLWPNRGFFIKVSDLSHALYVSLSEEENEMILGNKLKLGQFIYVQTLEKSHPVPLLRGVTPVPGQRLCEGMPEDIASPETFINLLESSPADSVVEKGVICEKKITIATKPMDSDPFCRINKKSKAGYHGKSSFRADNVEKFTSVNDADCFDNDSDADSVISSASSSRTLRRRSWNESELYGVKQIFNSSVNKKRIKLPPRSRSANVSPVRSTRYDSSDDNSSTSCRRRSNVSTKRPSKNSTKVVAKEGFQAHCQSLLLAIRGSETVISWNSLSPDIAKLGKEVVRQKEIALLAATLALQEAYVSESLLNSLRQIFELEEELARTHSIMKLLTSTESSPCSSIKETQRTQSIAPEIKKALSSNTPKPQTSCIRKTKRTSTSSINIPCILPSNKEDQPDWTKGCTLLAAANLAASLQEESRKVLLINIERFVDEVERRSCRIEMDREMAATMQKVKMVSDLLDMIVNKDGNDSSPKEGSLDEAEKAEAYERVRNKIYRILLKHVERTTMEFHRFKVTCR